MEFALPGLAPIPSNVSQNGAGTSCLRELQERLQSRARENSA